MDNSRIFAALRWHLSWFHCLFFSHQLGDLMIYHLVDGLHSDFLFGKDGARWTLLDGIDRRPSSLYTALFCFGLLYYAWSGMELGLWMQGRYANMGHDTCGSFYERAYHGIVMACQILWRKLKCVDIYFVRAWYLSDVVSVYMFVVRSLLIMVAFTPHACDSRGWASFGRLEAAWRLSHRV